MIHRMPRILFLTIATLLLTACSDYEGLYEPSCIAFEGDRIELRGGRFVWDRFTDARRIDGDGNVIDEFPDYPKTGTYSLESGRLIFATDDGVRLDDWFLVEQSGQIYLLTAAQQEAHRAKAEMPQCALLRGGNGA